MPGVAELGVARQVATVDRRGGRLRRLATAGLVVAGLVTGAACSGTEAGPLAAVTDEQLLGALLTVGDVGEGWTERGRGVDQATPAADGLRMRSDDPACQAVFDARLVDAADLLPDVSALLALEDPMVLVVEGIGVADPEQALGRARAVLGCSRLGFTIDWPSAGPGTGRRSPAWVASAVDVTVPGWEIVAYRAHPVSAEDAGESGRAVAGRDRLVVEININGKSVSEDLIQTVTTTALSRVDAEVFVAR
jgi:hypothetical protein